METGPIIIEQYFPVNREKVWEALTDPGLMRQWFFSEIEEFNPKTGFETYFEVAVGDRVFGHCWKLTEVCTPERIVYNWSYKGYAGSSVVAFELMSSETGTMLKLTHSGMESFPQDVPEFKRQSGLEGWKYFIQNSLKSFLDPGTDPE